MSKLADYDKHNYDYSTYWRHRKYEHLAELSVIDRFVGTGDRFIDIGGSFGRLAPTYTKRYKEAIIVDYSHHTLANNYAEIVKKHPNIKLIAANAYKLPFADNSFDGGMMVRVLHHIDTPDTYFKELNRILTGNSTFIQEYANKYHIKARIKGLLTGDKSVFNVKPYQQPSAGNNEGAEKGEEVPFLNYHPKHMHELVKESQFKILDRSACSFLRSTPFSKKLPVGVSIRIEKLLQFILKSSYLTPSVFLKITTSKPSNQLLPSKDIFVCPACREKIDLEGEQTICKKCKKNYKKIDNVWDLRVQ